MWTTGRRQPTEAVYFNCVETDENVELSFVPRPFTAAMIATDMAAAIRPYSMAVAPFSSFKNLMTVRMSGVTPANLLNRKSYGKITATATRGP